MENRIQAIETVYDGYRFRSRLEARWAVFFDTAGIKYQYESEGYHYEDFDGNEYFYLPDFYLPDDDVYVEVKGSDKALEEDFLKIMNAVDWGNTPMSDGLLILGDIPDIRMINAWQIPIFPFLSRNKGVQIENAAFVEFWSTGGKHLLKGNEEIISFFATLPDNCFWTDGNDWNDETEKGIFTTNTRWLEQSLTTFNHRHSQKIREAFLKARQARFEHGEHP